MKVYSCSGDIIVMPCPECGDEVKRRVFVSQVRGKNYRELVVGSHSSEGNSQPWRHECKRTQPDEPMEWGSRVTVTDEHGAKRRWLRQHDANSNHPTPWSAQRFMVAEWKALLSMGQVTLGWEEDECV